MYAAYLYGAVDEKGAEQTEKEFADYMGVTQGMVSKWESREYNFTIKTLNDICEKLNLTLSVDIEQVNETEDATLLQWG